MLSNTTGSRRAARPFLWLYSVGIQCTINDDHRSPRWYGRRKICTKLVTTYCCGCAVNIGWQCLEEDKKRFAELKIWKEEHICIKGCENLMDVVMQDHKGNICEYTHCLYTNRQLSQNAKYNEYSISHEDTKSWVNVVSTMNELKNEWWLPDKSSHERVLF